ncbi:MAG TPA: TIR domain-containing protein [Ignavibacteria bacterium]|nr:TIR domain-containing protein [Ignavibacteria bacterium]HMQ99418.1 TIR domain-containing protein [Ignavibacteria bacterium]
MDRIKILTLLKEGAKTWNKWRKENLDVKIDLRNETFKKSDFSKMQLDNIDFTDSLILDSDFTSSKLTNVSFKDSYIENCNFSNALIKNSNFKLSHLVSSKFIFSNINNCIFDETFINETIFDNTELLESDLSNSLISFTIFNSTDLAKSNFLKSQFSYNIFADIDLSQVTGLETVIHAAPSTIGIDTLLNSEGNIDVKFLSGAGIPENIISNFKSIFGNSYQFYSCFISYNEKDGKFAKKIYDNLTNAGIRCWFAPENLKAGDPIVTRIQEAMNQYDKLILILSENSVSSKWVQNEIEFGLLKEKRTNTSFLFPIVLDKSINDSSSFVIQEMLSKRVYIDFSDWKNENLFKNSLSKLIRSLILSVAIEAEKVRRDKFEK